MIADEQVVFFGQEVNAAYLGGMDTSSPSLVCESEKKLKKGDSSVVLSSSLDGPETARLQGTVVPPLFGDILGCDIVAAVCNVTSQETPVLCTWRLAASRLLGPFQFVQVDVVHRALSLFLSLRRWRWDAAGHIV